MEPVNVLFDQLTAIMTGFIALLPQLGLAIVFLIVTWLVTKLARRILRTGMGRANMRRSLIALSQKLATVGIWIVGGLIATTIIFPSMTPGQLVAALGLGSIAIGFAFKDVFENFLAGILILFREPFKLNDLIEVDDIVGRVEEITIRDTNVRQTDGQRTVIPNAILFKEPVTVITDLDIRRTSIVCGVGYGEDVAKCRDIIQKAVESVDSVITDDKSVEVFAAEFGDSSINYLIRWWTKSSPGDIHASKDQVVESIKKALDAADVEIPFPYRTLTFAEPVTVEQKPGNKKS